MKSNYILAVGALACGLIGSPGVANRADDPVKKVKAVLHGLRGKALSTTGWKGGKSVWI